MTVSWQRQPLALLALIAAQVACAAFFLIDVARDGMALRWAAFQSPHFTVEALAAMALIAAVVFEFRVLMQLLRQKAHLEEQLGLASGAFHEIVLARFADWGLTPAEQDVAMFLLKGLAIPEIAQMRGSAEGTVKAHLHATYRKAGVSGRGALLSLFIEDLMSAPAAPAPAAPVDKPA